MIHNYIIINKKVQLNCESSPEISTAISELLELYPTSSSDLKPDIIINIQDTDTTNILYSNPSIHGEIDNGFIIKNNSSGTVSFQRANNEALIINYTPKASFLNINSRTRFFNNGEYSSISDRLSSVFFELILTPSTFFFDDIALIHSASFINNTQSFSIGGTGGIGKTSLEIELCFKGSAQFMNDDIAYIDSQGFIYPNYAKPKIYGYNLTGNTALKQEIFKNRSFLDKLSWTYKAKKNGIHKVRRKVKPQLFNAKQVNRIKLDKYALLSRHKAPSFKVRDLETETSARLTQDIIRTEYDYFFKHVIWHNYNCEQTGKEPIIKLSSINKQNISVLNKALATVSTKSVLIPQDIQHKDYLSNMKELVNSSL